MYFGHSLFQARKRSGLSQEGVAEKLGVSRQTVSKWETGETVPDIYQSKKMARLYGVSLDELIDFDADVREIQEAIEKTKAETEEKIDWTSAWGKKYPVLLQYRGQVAAEGYARQLSEMLDALKREYAYSEQDALLVLKDILYRVWKSRKEKKSGCPPAAQAGKGGRFCPFGGGAQVETASGRQGAKGAAGALFIRPHTAEKRGNFCKTHRKPCRTHFLFVAFGHCAFENGMVE